MVLFMLVSALIDYIQLIAVFMQCRDDTVDVIVVMGLNSDCQNDFLEAVGDLCLVMVKIDDVRIFLS